ncbi:hypothetical protein LR48_Vigan05g027100 [Vigna angularis]|uniref:Uncharacterized protein n=1 Tax=Phaseolus angularis TaxID=3914 RepID=A0A0L9UJD3_PHAAN|nr:hypothetical protein LR48_Vigan05g027100 [Vigna angularis]
MMSVTGKTIDFAGKNLVSCGCSSNASFDRHTVRNYARVSSKGCGRGYGACKLFCCTKRSTQCRVSSMKTAEPTVNGTRFDFDFMHCCFCKKLYTVNQSETIPGMKFEVILLELNKLTNCDNWGTQAIEGLNKGLNLKGFSEAPISAARFFEAVADDLVTLNKNLQSVSNASGMDECFLVFYLL